MVVFRHSLRGLSSVGHPPLSFSFLVLVPWLSLPQVFFAWQVDDDFPFLSIVQLSCHSLPVAVMILVRDTPGFDPASGNHLLGCYGRLLQHFLYLCLAPFAHA